MRNNFAFFVAVGLLAASGISAQQTRTVSVPATTTDEVLQAVRSDLQGSRADIIAKNVTLTADQAARFWPMFDSYQKEQNVIMDEQLRGIQRYIENFDSLDDEAVTVRERDSMLQARVAIGQVREYLAERLPVC